MEKKFCELLDGTIFFMMKYGKEVMCRKNRIWLTSNGFSNATIIDPEWDDDLFILVNDNDIVEVEGYKVGD